MCVQNVRTGRREAKQSAIQTRSHKAVPVHRALAARPDVAAPTSRSVAIKGALTHKGNHLRPLWMPGRGYKGRGYSEFFLGFFTPV